MLLTALPLRAHGQSLGDLAKKPGTPAPSGPSRSFSDKDLKGSSNADGVIPMAAREAADDDTPRGNTLSREEIVQRVMPAVVTIQTPNATGTGFFVDSGLILTNHHVVGSSNVVKVRFSDGTGANGTVLRLAQDADLALVKVDGAGASVKPVVLGSYRQLKAGEDVVAIGSSLGVFENTVTRGIVSAVRRSTGVVYVQTDAAINPGNSGGPLVDAYGRAVGINTSKMSGAESLGFAIAIDHARRLINGVTYVADRAAPDATRTESAASAFNTPKTSESDDRHQAGLAQYDGAVRDVAHAADYVDGQWKQYVTNCGNSGAAASAGGRAWFAIWSGAGVAGNGNCPNLFRDMSERANAIKSAMLDATEQARRAGVYPGETRDVRRRYSLDYDGW